MRTIMDQLMNLVGTVGTKAKNPAIDELRALLPAGRSVRGREDSPMD